MTKIARRTVVLWGAGLAALASLAVFLGARARDDEQRRRSAEADYLAGRVTMVDGWIVSDSEARVRSGQK